MKKKIPALLAALLMTGGGLFAQATGAAGEAAKAADPLLGKWMTWVFLAMAAIVVVAAVLTMVKINAMMYREISNMALRAQGLPVPEPVAVPEGDSFWTKVRKRYWEDAVPVAQESAIMGHHEFDGIRELDNKLPPWWVNMFYLTIAFAVGYMFYYQWGGPGPSQLQEYEREMEAARLQKAIALGSAADRVNEETVVLLTEKSALGDGGFIFKQACAACHGQLGEGGVGPNFTDAHWLHGGGIRDIFKTIKYGVPEKGMKSWQAEIKPSDMQKVASYIHSLRGTNPPNPKAPEGEVWVEKTAADSVAKAAVKN